MKFHLDENVDHAIADGLRQRGIDVTTSTEAGLLRAPDPQQLAYALAQGRVILTQDRDLLTLAAQGIPHAGIAYWKVNRRTVGQIILATLVLHQTMTADEMVGRVEFL
jgi:predicted nuclease of predicted toxin-antitoxin system